VAQAPRVKGRVLRESRAVPRKEGITERVRLEFADATRIAVKALRRNQPECRSSFDVFFGLPQRQFPSLRKMHHADGFQHIPGPDLRQ